ncbi:hypothetical protein O6H91_06G038000 [Diphasiastrum complanatum]|uniref:Uncharacterized protein n=1 Tax=Diphasiastrum complanatum TaxID=34168 RepID=A0ACC2DCK8_DIPCM|nr:hypothetical protein O6H91_Y275500 [Diphasiastrum complanatum]KAJ7552004.1 hypothetical protein O6H91_06G038000 [Diphasiastrum complanatum]
MADFWQASIWLILIMLITMVVALRKIWQLPKCPKRRLVGSNGMIPQGRLCSLPFFGETFEFLKDPHGFHQRHMARYGETFYSYLFGGHSITLTTPEACRWVLQTAQKDFKPGYPHSATSILDETGSIYEENFHSRMRRIVGPALHPEALQLHVKCMDALASIMISKWEDNQIVNLHQELRRYTFFVASRITCGLDPGKETNEMADLIKDVKRGFISLHLNLPFTNYRRALKARDVLYHSFQEIIDKRRSEGTRHNDVLDALLTSEVHGGNFTDLQLRAIILTLMFGGYETTSSQLVWTIKRLHDHPKILEDVRAEHEAIRKRKSNKDEPLTWEDIKDMKLTDQVIQETMRTSYLNMFIPREALKDLEYNGLFVPKGWKVHASISSFHLNPKVFPDPYKFEPSRFQENPLPGTYMPYGFGNRMCLGSDLAKSQMLIFIHHLVSSKRFEAAGPDKGIRWWPIPSPKGGYPIRIRNMKRI